METAPRDNLTRFVPFETFAVTRDDGGDGLTLRGHGSVFNVDTVIDNWEGNFVERVAPGAWKRTLGNRTPVMQFDHGMDSRIGATPIGVYTDIREDDIGLLTVGRMHDNEQVRPVRDAIASGAIRGMSTRFRVVRDRWEYPEDGLPIRTILEAELYEVGPVVFPAYATTSVGVRSRDARQRRDRVAELRELARHKIEPAGTPNSPAGTSEHRATDGPADTPSSEELVSTPSTVIRKAERPVASRERIASDAERLAAMLSARLERN